MSGADYHGIAVIICLVGAVIVASSGHDGWGWLLVIALLLS